MPRSIDRYFLEQLCISLTYICPIGSLNLNCSLNHLLSWFVNKDYCAVCWDFKYSYDWFFLMSAIYLITLWALLDNFLNNICYDLCSFLQYDQNDVLNAYIGSTVFHTSSIVAFIHIGFHDPYEWYKIIFCVLLVKFITFSSIMKMMFCTNSLVQCNVFFPLFFVWPPYWISWGFHEWYQMISRIILFEICVLLINTNKMMCYMTLFVKCNGFSCFSYSGRRPYWISCHIDYFFEWY